ncbi:FCD domain-containing protein [Paracoccus sp. S-4012]|uniref:GntR family transcriptional regulator n=1 Tax=Paracoccus sp. S-4012 TaxID=2665648 RepID=UPI0012B072F4|nr:FCD domain-containing protein [Paracoccus sp. S-4012]MRX50646.1 FCD domain-containing protein [Paracoccus sp. S-4012]
MTLAESTYHSLRDDILRGRLLPDQPLRLEFLKSRYGTSFSPLREALNRLQAERLVVNGPGRGFVVSPVSPAELWDAMEVRILIEAEALRRAIARGDDAWEAEVVATFHALDLLSRRLDGAEAAADADLAELEARHRDFHLALLRACGSPRLLDLFHQLHAETQRYRLLTFTPARGRTRRDVSREHREIMHATLDRREDEAVELLTAHYRRTAEAIHPLEA